MTNKMNQLLLCVVFLLWGVNSVFAQRYTKTEQNADIVEYTNKDGLPTTNFTSFAQTKDGYIWMAGVEGTYRFNGYQFDEVGKRYGVPQMQALYYDSTSNMLYFASPHKFITFDGQKFTTYGEKEGYRINGLPGQVISFVKADSRGRIWIGSQTPFVDQKFNGGLTRFENGAFTVYDSTSFPLDNATGFIESPYADLIFASAGSNTQTGEDAYIALLKEGKFRRIGPEAGVKLQVATLAAPDLGSSVDSEGNTWIAFNGVLLPSLEIREKTAGVLMYDGRRFRQYPGLKKHLTSSQGIATVFYSQKDNKVYATAFSVNGELFDPGNKTIFKLENGRWTPSDFFREVKTVKNLKTGETITDFRYLTAVFSSGNRYFPEMLSLIGVDAQGTSAKYPNQIFTRKNGKWQKLDAFNGNPVLSTNDGFMLGTSGGFGFYYPSQSRMLTVKDGLLSHKAFIPALFSDRNGVVWISYSFTQDPAYLELNNLGINIWDGKKLRVRTEKNGLASNITFETYQDRKNRVWIPTAKGITLAREIRNSRGDWIFKFQNIRSARRKTYNVTSVRETANGDIYAWQNYVRPASRKMIPADFYLGKYNGEKFLEIKSPFSAADNAKKHQLFKLLEMNDGRLWLEGLFADRAKELSSVPSKVMIFDGRKWQKPPESYQIPDEQLHYVGKLKSAMYFLTVGGFYKFDGKRFINLSDSVNADADFRILKGASVAGTSTNIQSGNRLYVRLRNQGLVIFDGTHLNFYTKKNGLPSTNLYNPTPDSRGNLFFSHPSGALKITGEKFQPYYDDESVVTGGAYVSTMDGSGNLVLFYRGVGLYIKKMETRKYPIRLSSVTIDTATYYGEFPAELPHSRNSLLFNFAALNYKNPKQTSYEHILEGYDREWSRPGNLAFAEYQNLPPGDYTFRVQGTTSNGVKTDEASYTFSIHPPLWKTGWAYALYILLVGLALFSVRKFEKNRLLHREEKRRKEELAEARLKETELRAQAAEAQSRAVQAENERKSKELEEARQLQLSMLPRELPQLPSLDIAVYMQTATEVGGDYYDFHVGMDGTLTVVIGDATGHGLNAGTIVTATKSLFNTHAANPDILFTVAEISRCIRSMHFRLLSMCLSVLKIEGNTLRMTAAGMPPALIYREKGKLLEEMMIKGMPLGAARKFPYKLRETTLAPGDTILLCSDGFPELFNKDKEMFGYERARATFEEIAPRSAEAIVEHLKNAASDWTGGEAPNDDVTFVVLKIK